MKANERDELDRRRRHGDWLWFGLALLGFLLLDAACNRAGVGF